MPKMYYNSIIREAYNHMKNKIAFFEFEPWEKDYVVSHLKNDEFLFIDKKLTDENVSLANDCQIISAFVDSQFPKEIIEKLPNLKMIATRSTGYDHIDLEFCKEKNITVCNVPTYGENTVAEHAFALILDLSRKISDSIERVKKEGFTVEGLQGFDLKGKTLGIVGMGHIGQHVARIANGFEMKTLAFDLKQDKKLAKQLNFEYATLENLLKSSDIITLHLPHNDATHHLINEGNIKTIKRGAYLINTARGGIIETAALVGALDLGILAGAGLDVLEEECFVKEESQLLSKSFHETCDIKAVLANHILMDRKNVIITPHNAFNSREAVERILETTVDNIKGFLEAKPINIVS